MKLWTSGCLSILTTAWVQVNDLFGNENKESLQKIHGLFSQAGSMLRATYYNKGPSIVGVGGKEYSTAYYDIVWTEGKIGHLKEILTEEIERLNNSMVIDLTNEKVGFLRNCATQPKSCKCCLQVCFWHAAKSRHQADSFLGRVYIDYIVILFFNKAWAATIAQTTFVATSTTKNVTASHYQSRAEQSRDLSF
jgi:hypothetical protein